MPVESKIVLHWKQIEKEHASQLGQKCYSLVHYKKAGFPVPPFLAVPNTVIAQVLRSGEVLPYLQNEVVENVLLVEEETGLKFGGEEKPLILATRSGDPRSLYGSLLTIPGVGLNDQTCKGLVNMYGPRSESEALWLYLDLIVDFAVHVEGIEKERIRPLLTEMKEKNRSPAEMKELIHKAQNAKRFFGIDFSFPQNVYDQLMASIRAVAFSWNSTRAQCAAMALGLDPQDPANLPSVFVQQMKFTSLTSNSAFISLLTHPELSGTFSPATVGRRVMFGIAKNILELEALRAGNPALYSRIYDELVVPIVRSERNPVNMEIAVERGEPYLIQVGPAALSPAVHVEAINKLVEEQIISEAEAVRKRGEVQRQGRVTVFKLNPEASLELLVKGKPGAPGAITGRVAVSPEQALAIKKAGKRVILFSALPQNEDVYRLTVGRNLDGIGLTFGAGQGSHITSFAEANGIPVIASLRSVAILPDGIRIGERIFRVGDERLVINGSGGELFLAGSGGPEPIVEDKTVEILSYGINYIDFLRSVRNWYQSCDYEELLAWHAMGAEELRMLPGDTPKDLVVGLQAQIHCLHLLAYEKGEQRYGEGYVCRVDLDVAVADGNLNRVPGLEDKRLYIEKKEDGLLIIMGSEYLGYDFGLSFPKVMGIAKRMSERGLNIGIDYSRQSRMHTSLESVSSYGIEFKTEDLGKVIDHLREYFENQCPDDINI
jgi:pyruvate,orthophosphate dikinase